MQLYVTGRKKELIKYQGHHVSPSELESLIATYKGVLSVCIIGIPDMVNMELPAAAIIQADSSNLTAEEIINFVKSMFIYLQ